MGDQGFPVDAGFLAKVMARHGGDPQALIRLGLRLVTGDDAPHSPTNGAALIVAAADLGDAQAWRLVAGFAAQGLAQTPSIAKAYAALERALALGDPDARQQHAFLRGLALESAQAAERWLVETPAAETLGDDPRVCVYREFIPQSLCRHLMDISRTRLVRAEVHDLALGTTRPDAMRTNRRAPFSALDITLPVQLLRMRIARVSGVEAGMLEAPEVLRYAVGEQYKLHVDYLNTGVPRFAEHVRIHGQRTKTALIYLNDGYAGGETDFPRLGIRFRGRPGDALVFENVGRDGNGDARTAHEGRAPSAGEKWLLSQWIRDKAQQFC
jgi:prolyl 4-hydroxylase